MNFTAERIPYHKTNSFSKIVLDYLDQSESLQSYFSSPPTLQGIEQAIHQKKKQSISRSVLVTQLQKQYSILETGELVKSNIELLASENTFSICTAHQPNLFTGPLYFIYKILHVIKLSLFLKSHLPQYNFVPIFYMGSEDADLAELNNITVDGKKYEWETDQKGAVGRMQVDKKLLDVIQELKGQLSTEKYGAEFIGYLKEYYVTGATIQIATLKLVDALFKNYGLVVLIADDAQLKQQMLPVFEDDLFHQKSSQIVEATCTSLNEHYNVQANPRDINLFYLKDDIRERIIERNGVYAIHGTSILFTTEELKKELQQYPERFSPNVILRGLYQETILPNVAFIGGGSELAYWLQLKDLFQHYSTPFPVLVLRNSFLLLHKQQHEFINRLDISSEDIFKNESDILNRQIEKQGKKLQLNGELYELQKVYDQIKTAASLVDPTLAEHVAALKTKTSNQLITLEDKMLRAERKKYEALKRQISKVKTQLFPVGGLQERTENISAFYAKWGREIILKLYEFSPALEQEFSVISEA
ncbi:MAG: bacillithiol biosynthesis cysteine-adding enzyme BshC [Chitinophagaceae bacterium]